MSDRITYMAKIALNEREEIAAENKHSAGDDNEIKVVVNSHADDIENLQASQADSYIRKDTVVDEGDGRTFFPVTGDPDVIYVATKMDDPDENGNYDWDGANYVYSEYQTVSSSTVEYIEEYTSISESSINKDVVLPVLRDKFIDPSGDIQPSGTGSKCTSAIPLSSFNDLTNTLVDIGNDSKSISAISYFNSSTVEAASFISSQFENADSGTGTNLKNVRLVVPSGATHVALSSRDGFDMNLFINNPTKDVTSRIDNIQRRDLKKIDITLNSSEFISRDTFIVTATASELSRTNVIDLSTIDKYNAYVDIGTRGGSVVPVAYYSSSTISLDNMVGHEIDTDSVTYEQLIRYKLNPPANATHMVLSCFDEFELNLYTVNDSYINYDESLKVVSNTYQSLAANPYNSEAKLLQKRSSLLLNLPNDSVDFVIFTGQSNMDGRVEYTYAPAWFTATNGKMDDFMMWNRVTKEFAPYEKGVNTGADDNASDLQAPDIYFAKEWLDANPGKKLYAYKKTKGGTPLSSEGLNGGSWNPITEDIDISDRKLCEETLDELKDLISYIKVNTIQLNPIGVCFSQGGSDADLAPTGTADYPQNLKNWISWFRGLFLTPNLPVANIQISTVTDTVNREIINDTFTDLNAIDENFKTTDMSSQTTVDGIHWNQAGAEFAGIGMYNNIISLRDI